MLGNVLKAVKANLFTTFFRVPKSTRKVSVYNFPLKCSYDKIAVGEICLHTLMQ